MNAQRNASMLFESFGDVACVFLAPFAADSPAAFPRCSSAIMEFL